MAHDSEKRFDLIISGQMAQLKLKTFILSRYLALTEMNTKFSISVMLPPHFDNI